MHCCSDPVGYKNGAKILCTKRVCLFCNCVLLDMLPVSRYGSTVYQICGGLYSVEQILYVAHI